MTHFAPDEHNLLQASLPPELYSAAINQPSESTLRMITSWLHERIIAISRFVPTAVVRFHLANPQPGLVHGSLRQGSLLFADLSGFTALSEHLASLGKEGSEEITRVVNRLFAALTEQVARYGGDLIKFNGDALTAFFDAEILGAHHAEWAVGAAQMMQHEMQSVGTVDTRLGQFQLSMRIGVHSGDAFVAMLGDQQHQELVLIGDDVNKVARAQEVARPGEVVVSQETIALIDGTLVRDEGHEFCVLEPVNIAPPTITPGQLEFPPDTNDRHELMQMVAVYAALRLFLPQNLTERQLIEADELATGGLRLVAVLFAHIAPFSQIIKQLSGDTAQITELLNLYYTRMQMVINHYGGVINKLDLAPDGDKLLAIFGAPIAHENDAELALRAGLTMQEAINEINVQLYQHSTALPLLDQKIGINQGHVFAGLVGGTQRREYTVMGDTVNIAARLMSQTPPGDILIGPMLRRTSSTDFEFETLPPLQLKGKREMIEPARIIRTYNVRREFSRAPLVGRDSEIQAIKDVASTALRGNGQAIAISGEAGIGKSRLIEEALQWLTLHSFDSSVNIPPFTPITVECQFYEQTTPFASARDLLQQMLRIRTAQSSSEQMQQVYRRIEQLTPELARFGPLLSDVLRLPLPDSDLTSALTPEQRHQRTIDLVEALIVASAKQTPTVILWDDVHWIDASSQEVIDRLVRSVQHAPLLLIVAYRPEQELSERWTAKTNAFHLNELDETARVELASSLLNGSVPTTLLERWQQGDEQFFNPQGNPFFIEEMIRTLLDQQILVRTNGQWELQGDLEALPTTIEGVITARLDRLEARYRETLQIASVVGRRFQYTILSGITHVDDLTGHLHRLISTDLVLPDQIATELAYLFKHTLTRDVAYESILYARRRELHRRVAQRIEEVYHDQLEEVLAVLARHYARAEDWVYAIHYYTEAGKKAQDSYANKEASTHYQTAIELLQEIKQPAAELQVELYERLGYVNLQAGQYDEALRAFNTALEHLQTVASPASEHIARLYRHIATVYERRAEFNAGLENLAHALAGLANRTSLEYVRILIRRAGIYYRIGEYKKVLVDAEQAIDTVIKLDSIEDLAQAYGIMGVAYSCIGENNKSISMSLKSIEYLEKSKNILLLSNAYSNTAANYYKFGDIEKALSFHEKAYKIRLDIKDDYGLAIITNNIGDLYLQLGQVDRAISKFEESLTYWDRIQSAYGTAILSMNLGAAYLTQGDLALSRKYLEQSLRMYEQMNIREYIPEIYRYFAELERKSQQPQQAIEYCQASINVAQELSLRLEEGLSLLLLGKIHIEQASQAQAQQALGSARTIFTEIANEQYLQECEALLHELASFS